MTVKELLKKEPYPDTPVGIYELSEDNKLEPLLLGDRLAAIESRYAEREIEDSFEAYYEPAQKTGIVIYVKREERLI